MLSTRSIYPSSYATGCDCPLPPACHLRLEKSYQRPELSKGGGCQSVRSYLRYRTRRKQGQTYAMKIVVRPLARLFTEPKILLSVLTSQLLVGSSNSHTFAARCTTSLARPILYYRPLVFSRYITSNTITYSLGLTARTPPRPHHGIVTILKRFDLVMDLDCLTRIVHVCTSFRNAPNN